MNIVAVINYKGGVGKTSVTANVGAELAWRGHNVLLVDLDPQASLTFSLVEPDAWKKNYAASKTIKAWFDSLDNPTPTPLGDLVTTPQRAGHRLKGKGRLDLIASHLGLIDVDLELATQLGGATMAQTKKKYLRVHQRLLHGLADLAGDYDVVLLDCPPNFNIVTKNAIVASTHILAPAKPDYLSTLGIDYLKRNVDNLVKNYNEYAEGVDGSNPIQPVLLGIVFTMVQEYDNQPISAQRAYIAQTKKLGLPVLTSYVKENKTVFADAPEDGVPVVLNDYTNGSHLSVRKGIEALVDELKPKLGL